MSGRAPERRHRLVFGILIGLAIGALAVPATIAGAAGLKFVGIEGGTSLNKAEVNTLHQLLTAGVDQVQGPSHNTADVTPANQLLTAEAALSTHYISLITNPSPGQACGVDNCVTVVALSPAGRALVLTSIKVNTYANFGPPDVLGLFVGPANCDGDFDFLDISGFTQPATFDASGNPVYANGGTDSLAYEPGLEIPAGKALCGYDNDEAFSVQANGYTVPAAAVTLPLGHAHHVPKLKHLVHK
jgi:hypothetical protein